MLTVSAGTFLVDDINPGPASSSPSGFQLFDGNVYVRAFDATHGSELWRVTGQRMPHPFHIHGASFQILTQQGKPPAEADRGWKDTVVVWDEVTEIIVRFDHEATDQFPYMYHCHMLEHEDGGMMGQFTVVNRPGFAGDKPFD